MFSENTGGQFSLISQEAFQHDNDRKKALKKQNKFKSLGISRKKGMFQSGHHSLLTSNAQFTQHDPRIKKDPGGFLARRMGSFTI